MIHVTREMYQARGFDALPDNRVEELITRAGLYAQEQTLGRVQWSFVPLKKKRYDKLTERNIRGICSLADLFFRNEAAVGENGAAIIAFANEGYRETYEGGARVGSTDLFLRRLNTAMQAYFSQEQLSRQVN